MADRLKIYACSGLEDSAKSSIGGYKYWSDGSDPVNNTQAVNSLIAKINLCRSELINLAGLTEEDKIDLLNEIVFYNVCLYFEREYTDDPKMLNKAGMAISKVFDGNKAYNASLTVNNYSAYVDSLVSQVIDAMDGNSVLMMPKNFGTWWQKNVTNLNKVGLSENTRLTVRNTIAKRRESVGEARDGWQNDKNIGEYLTNASEYFLYTYFTDAQLKKLPYIFKYRRKRQEYIYNYCKPFFIGVYGTEEDLQNVIRGGIVGYFKHQPEEVCAKIVNGDKIENIGGDPVTATAAAVWTVADIVAVITACLSLIGSVIIAVIDLVKQTKIAEEKAIDKDAANAGVPNPEDFSDKNFEDLLGKDSGKSWITIALIAVGALLLFKKD